MAPATGHAVKKKTYVGKSLFFLWVHKYDLVPLCVRACVHARKLCARSGCLKIIISTILDDPGSCSLVWLAEVV